MNLTLSICLALLVHWLLRPVTTFRRHELRLVTGTCAARSVTRIDLTQISLHISKWCTWFEKPQILQSKNLILKTDTILGGDKSLSDLKKILIESEHSSWTIKLIFSINQDIKENNYGRANYLLELDIKSHKMFKPLNFVFTGFYSIMNKKAWKWDSPQSQIVQIKMLSVSTFIKKKVKANKISNSRMKSYGLPVTN